MRWWQRLPKVTPEIVDLISGMVNRGVELVQIREELARRAKAGDLDHIIARSITRAQRVAMFEKTGLWIE